MWHGQKEIAVQQTTTTHTKRVQNLSLTIIGGQQRPYQKAPLSSQRLICHFAAWRPSHRDCCGFDGSRSTRCLYCLATLAVVTGGGDVETAHWASAALLQPRAGALFMEYVLALQLQHDALFFPVFHEAVFADCTWSEIIGGTLLGCDSHPWQRSDNISRSSGNTRGKRIIHGDHIDDFLHVSNGVVADLVQAARRTFAGTFGHEPLAKRRARVHQNLDQLVQRGIQGVGELAFGSRSRIYRLCKRNRSGLR